MSEIIDIDETIMKVNRVVDELFYDIVEVYDWNDISETGVYNEDNWRVEELTDEQLKKYMAKKAKLDKVMISTAMQVCHMEDADIKEFAGYARLGKHYVLRALIKLNNMERAKDLELISNDTYYENYGIQEVEEMLKNAKTLNDAKEINEFIRDNRLPEKAYFMVDEFIGEIVKDKLLKSQEISIKDKLELLDMIDGREFISVRGHRYGGYYKYNLEALQQIVTRSDEEALQLVELTDDLNYGLYLALKTNNIKAVWLACHEAVYDEIMTDCKEQLADKKVFAKFERLVAEQDASQYLWFINCAMDGELGDNINWEFANNTILNAIKNSPDEIDEIDLHYVFSYEGFDREKITEALLQDNKIEIISAMDSIFDLDKEFSKKDKKLIAKLFFAKCVDHWDSYNAFAKFAPEYTEKLYKKMLEYKEEYDKLATKTKRTKEQDKQIEEFASELAQFEQDHPEVLDQGLKQ